MKSFPQIAKGSFLIIFLFQLSSGYAQDEHYVVTDSSNFSSQSFDDPDDFNNNVFQNSVSFYGSRFLKGSNWSNSIFRKDVNFSYARFDTSIAFWGHQFDSTADFSYGQFFGDANFYYSKFLNKAIFSHAQFDNCAAFFECEFDSTIKFNYAEFYGPLIFLDTILPGADFNNCIFADQIHLGTTSSTIIPVFDFNLATFIDKSTVQIIHGAPDIHEVFELLNLGAPYTSEKKRKEVPGVKIILHGPIVLKCQLEKLKYFSLFSKLDYYRKKYIVDSIKEKSFSEEKYSKERFELDYLFAKSTMYQEKTSIYAPNKWHHVGRWPKWFCMWLYNATMGLGYRPFRLIYWVIGLILLFTFIYTKFLSKRINAFLSKDWKSELAVENDKDSNFIIFWGNLLNALYFSVSIFFTFRLQKDILIFFSRREKFLIAIEWVLGFFIYFSFVAFSKKGSFLNTITALFTS
ncbi:MAG: pentapeptide repeat-containing protein [Candidatus Delongbacteria bacterium]|nr:pentapeptide repeat-containing protein [Candidatus Delongbacteria bacterium]